MRQVLVGGVGGIEAVAAVGVEREPGDRGIEAEAEDGASIDVAVVGGDGAGDGGVLAAGVGVGNGHRHVVGAGERDGEGGLSRGAVLVGDGVVGHHIGGLAWRQVLVGGIGGIEAVAAVGVEREPGDRGIEAEA